MINKFLSAKHWQIFLCTIGIPIVLQFYFMFQMISLIKTSNDKRLQFDTSSLYMYLIVICIYFFIYYGWLWSINVGLDRYLAIDLKLKLKRFKWIMLLQFISIAVFGVLSYDIFIKLFSGEFLNDFTFFYYLIPFQLFIVCCSIYSLYFSVKTIRTLELQKEVKFDECIGDFFLFWFFPIGIWFLQPRINRLNEERNDSFFLLEK